ncbi:MAG: hypothetical protein KKH12_15960 [Gammaproteobacteria bacterium]|nr:hypothetical protein [Gammaproteobacteria bacterium]
MSLFGVRSSDDTDIMNVLWRHNLKPRRMGGQIRFLCPFCADDHSKKEYTGSAKADDPEGKHPWMCWRASCEAKGDLRTLLAHFGELDVERATRIESRPKPPPKPKLSKAEIVRKSWDELLDTASFTSSESIYMWCVEERGWPHDLSSIVCESDNALIVEHGNMGGKFGAIIGGAALRLNRRLLVPLRCQRGIVRSVMRIWAGPGPADDGRPSKMALSSTIAGESSEWGGVMLYGSIPGALEAARNGNSIYIVEGAPDMLSAEALLTMHGESGVVLGGFNAQTLRGLFEALRSALANANIIAPKVVLIPDLDRPIVDKSTGREMFPGIDAMERGAEILKGRAGVHMLRLPRADARAKMDLSEYIKNHGCADAMSLLRVAPPIYPAPEPLEDSQVKIAEFFARAITEATESEDEHQPLVVFRVEMGAGKSYTALQQSASIVTGAQPIKLTGRRPKGHQGPWPPAERSVIFASSHHGEASEKVGELEKVAPGTPSAHLLGMLKHCRFSANVADVFPHVGRRGICGIPSDPDNLCDHYYSCPGAREPEVHRGEVTFCAHAMVDRLSADLVIIDENPGVIALEQVSADEIRSLFVSQLIPRVKRWRSVTNPDVGDASQIIDAIITPLAASHAAAVTAGKAAPYTRNIAGKELIDLLEHHPGLIPMLETGTAPGSTPPPTPFPAEIRSGVHAQQWMPSRTAFNAMGALLNYYRAEKKIPAAEGAPRTLASIHLNIDGTWGMEVRRVSPLPDSPTIILDATGEETLDEWKAAYPERRVVIRGVDVQGRAPAAAIHLEAQIFSRKALLTEDRHLSLAGLGAVRDVIEKLIEEARGHRPGRLVTGAPLRLGLLTHKPIADALLGAVVGSVADEAKKMIMGFADSNVLFTNEAGEPTIGYYGRDDRATNAYREVDGLVVIGDPIPNFGATEMDALLLGVDASSTSAARTASTVRQAIARARHLRRGSSDRAVLMFAGRTPPRLPGVAWTERPIAGGIDDSDRGKLLEVCFHLAHVHGCLGHSILTRSSLERTAWEWLALGGFTSKQMHFAIRRVVRMLKWEKFSVLEATAGPPRSLTIWGKSEQAAKAWVAAHTCR